MKVVPSTAATTQISPELLIEELELVKSHLLKIHPQPFARISQNNFYSQLNLLKETLIYPISRSEFYLRLAPLLASLKDIHTFTHLPKDQYGDFKRQQERLLPLALIIENNKVYVAADLSNSPIVMHGAEVLTINGAPVSFLLNIMRDLTTQETETGQTRKIQMEFSWLLAAMGYASETYKIVYLWQGKEFETELTGLKVNSEDSSKTQSYYGFSKLKNNTALLWLNDFSEQPEVFDRYLDDVFSTMKLERLDNLIIDLRYNSGGRTDNLKNLLSRITNKPIYWAKKGIIKVSSSLKANHRKKTRQRRKDKYNWALQWLPLEWTDSLQHSIWWADTGETLSLDLKSVKPNKNKEFKGVWVLTNGFCYSACSFFVASVNHYKLGQIVGEKPGSLADFQFAYPVKVTLPHSLLTVTIPTMRLDFVSSSIEDLILPHETIVRSQADIEARSDPVMMRVIRQIRND